MRTSGLVAVALIAVSWFAVPAMAEQGDMRVQFGILAVSPTDDTSQPGATTEVEESVGYQVSFEYMFTDKIGLEPTLSASGHDVEVEPADAPEIDEFGEIDLMTLMIGVNFHVLEGGKVDLYVGPTVGYAFWDDFETDFFGPELELETDDEFIYGVQAGLDVPFGDSNWAFSAGLAWLFTDVTLKGDAGPAADSLGFDPLQARAGVAFKF